MSKIAFIGLGVMGYPMARHLKEGGHTVAVYNRTRSKAEKWANENNGSMAVTPKAAAIDAEFVFCCVGDDADVCSVILGDNGAFAGMRNNAVLIDNTTVSAVLARKLSVKGREIGVKVIDAPVSGGQIGAENGVLTVMCGGDETTFKRVEPIIRCYAQVVKLMGPAGSGQLAKMVNQLCIAGLLQGLSEGINFAIKAGLDIPNLIEVISKGAAQSWQMENRAATMAQGEFDFGFAVKWMRKDLAICMEEASLNGARLPVTTLINQYYEKIQARGGNRWDTSSLIDLLQTTK